MSNRLHKNVLKIFFMMRMLRLWLNMNIKTFQFRAFVVALVALVAFVALVVTLVAFVVLVALVAFVVALVALVAFVVALVVALVAFVVSLVVALVIEQNSTLRAILHIYLVFLPFKSTFQFIISFHM